MDDNLKIDMVEASLGNSRAASGAVQEIADADQHFETGPLSAARQHQLLSEWNATTVDYPRDKCLHTFIEEQVQRTPDALALGFEGTWLTYREMNTRANQLARHLHKLGVGPEMLVGICVERSLEMVIGLIGILKAGGAYVPLDPEYPKDRLAFMIDDANVSVLLTQGKLVDAIPQHRAKVVRLDADWASIAVESGENPPSGVTAQNLAYMIYTSGSTGRPKGAMNTHVAIVNRLLWGQDTYPIDGTDRVLQKTPFSFDVSVWEFFWPLVTGATLVIARPGGHKDSPYLAALVEREKITHMHFVPSMLSVFLNEPGLEKLCMGVKRVICSGEALPVELQNRFFARMPSQLLNLYGPTEAAVEVTYWECERNSRMKTVPIGRPIANVQIHILDEKLKPVQIGTPGELHIGGIAVARGYLNRAELTAEKFIPDPFSKEPGARLYKTGDLARHLPNGAVDYLGRIDHQVKIRGFRIELGEIESVLQQFPGIREASVIAPDDGAGDKQLVAYYTNTGDRKSIPPSELRVFLKEKLPEYMVPAFYMRLDAFPLSPNGKLDRKALPEPKTEPLRTEGSLVAPRNDTEKALAEIWLAVLGIKQVGVTDNFFDLGGHSLRAMQVISRIRNRFKVTVELQAFFARPTIADIALEVEKARVAGAEEVMPPILVVQRKGDLPLSFSQERLWFLDQLEPNRAIYNIPIALRLSGALDAQLLKRCAEEVVRRHEVLRTRYESIEGRPVQIVEAFTAPEMKVIDLSAMPESAREAEVIRLSREEARRPFDLTRDCMLRLLLLQLGASEHQLMFNMHHIASDGWSVGLVLKELETLYGAFSKGEPSPIPPLPVQYIDYAVWQRGWLQGDVLSKQVAYWRKQLGGAPPLLELPVDRPRPPVQSYRGAQITEVLPKTLSDAMQGLAQKEDATLFMTFLAAFKVLLYRYASVEDILVGSPIAGRNQVELESLMGFFVNTLVLRTNVSGNPTFKELLGRVRQTTLGAYAHQDLPFDKLVDELKPERNLSYGPLIQVFFAVENRGLQSSKIAEMDFKSEWVDTGTSKFDLMLYVFDQPDGLKVLIEYNTDIFEEETIRRMIGNYRTLLEGITANPESRVANVPMVSLDDREHLLLEWNATGVKYPRDRCLHTFIEEQVERTPDAIALSFEGEKLSYREMNKRANQLARHLQKLGVGPETLVGICAERSLEMVIGLVGILKAGGAYVPLDPEYPRDRLEFMIEDAKVAVLLTQARLAASIPPHRAKVIKLDEDWPLIAKEDGTNPPSAVTARNMAYTIYTSGSTGRPKGAINEHAPVANRLLWGQNAYPISGADRVLQKTPFSFDVSVWEFFWPLMNGATLVVARPGGHKDAHYIAGLVEREKITHLHFVPSMLSVFLNEPGLEESCVTVKRVLCSGEALPLELQNRFFARFKTPQLLNLYGPTEAAVEVTYWECQRNGNLRTVPIGKPIANVQIHILDEQLKRVPIGTAGELHIGGIAVARGYLNRPELTAEKFIHDPFSTEAGARLYKTGDLAKHLPDGAIEYLGRIDHQVKIRGFRIELGEIETVMQQCAGVGEAVVVARTDASGDTQLVSYYTTPGRTDAIPVSTFRSFLKQKLPDYMVPSLFVRLDAFPLNPNGKLDRKQLPAPEAVHVERVVSFVPARNETEEVLAQIWCDVLKVKQVGVLDNFFELGGHSLLAVRVQARIEKLLGKRLPLTAFFKTPTIEGLAKSVMDSAKAEHGVYLTPVDPSAKNVPLFCLHFLTSAQQLAKHLGPKWPVFGVESFFDKELRVWHDQGKCELSIEQLAASSVEIIRRAQPTGPYHLMGFCFGGVLAYEVACQLKQQGQEVAFLMLLDAYYIPGCRKYSMPGMRRLVHHAREASRQGVSYLWKKWRTKVQLARKRKDKVQKVLGNIRVAPQADAEAIQLPQAKFLRELLSRYRAKQYSGDAVLFRAAGEVNSFEYDFGTDNGWQTLVKGKLLVDEFQFNHMNFSDGPHVAGIANRLKYHLDQAEAGVKSK